MKLESHHEISKRIRISRVIHFSFIVISLSLSKINIFWIKLEFRYRLRENFNIFPKESFGYLRFQFQNNKKLIFRRSKYIQQLRYNKTNRSDFIFI